MTPLQLSRPSSRYEASKHPASLTVDANAPCMRDFVQRHVLKGTIRVIPAGRGRLAILPTAARFPDGFLHGMTATGEVDRPFS